MSGQIWSDICQNRSCQFISRSAQSQGQVNSRAGQVTSGQVNVRSGLISSDQVRLGRVSSSEVRSVRVSSGQEQVMDTTRHVRSGHVKAWLGQYWPG